MNTADFSRYSTDYLYELMESIQTEIKIREDAVSQTCSCFVCTKRVSVNDAFALDRGDYACHACFQRSEFIRQRFHRAFFYDVIDDGEAEYS